MISPIEITSTAGSKRNPGEQKTTIIAKRSNDNKIVHSTQHSKTNNYEYTFVQNSYATDELYTAAKASSIGSTDKRSQLSSDSVRKRDYMAIT